MGMFRHVGREEIAWRTELGADDPSYVELFWIDVRLEDGTQVGVGLYRSRPYDQGRPAVTVNVLRPDRPTLEQNAAFSQAEFLPAAFGGRWGTGTELVGELDADGNPQRVGLRLDVGRVQVDLRGDVICGGVKFTDSSPGFSHYRPATGTAVGWWPVAPRVDVSGTVTVDGEVVAGSGRMHVEKQLSSLPLAGSEGAASSQSIWTWGHFSAGDYTGIWTDSAASEHLGYRHFTPFVLYHGGVPLMSTFEFASYVERFVIEESTGLPRPVVVTLKAADAGREFFARLTDGRISDQFELDGTAGAYYCRQVGSIDASLHHWGRSTRLAGDAVYEWGTKAGNFPFATLR